MIAGRCETGRCYDVEVEAADIASYFLSCISAVRVIHPRMPVIISPNATCRNAAQATLRRRNSTTIQTDSPTIPTPLLPHLRRSRTSRPNQTSAFEQPKRPKMEGHK